jgi:glycosyltransferase involved in cell wall biosynthesis
MRFHILGIPHTVTRPEYSACAFTQKVLKLCKMLKDRGHTVYHYGHEESVVECTEHITVTTNEDLQKAYGSYDWRKEFFKHDTGDYAHKMFNLRAATEVAKRKKPRDFLLMMWDYGHRGVMDANKDLIAVEPGVGFTSPLACTPYTVYESYSVMAYAYGKASMNPRFYDAVIPNYFDLADFVFNPTPQDYLVFVGRIIGIKGIQVILDIAKRTGKKIKIAGQGDITTITKEPLPPNIELIGYVEPAARSELMKNAVALLLPTYYNEPFGGVIIEAMLCGTPVITTDWGAFAENNLHGVTGYRCRTMDHFDWAVQACYDGKISREACRKWAAENFSLERVALMYEEYFDMLHKIHGGKGFYEVNPDRKDLDWMVRRYPF